MNRNELNRYGSQLMSMQLDCKWLDLQCWYKNKTGCSLELSQAERLKLEHIQHHPSTNRKGRPKSQVISLIGQTGSFDRHGYRIKNGFKLSFWGELVKDLL